MGFLSLLLPFLSLSLSRWPLLLHILHVVECTESNQSINNLSMAQFLMDADSFFSQVCVCVLLACFRKKSVIVTEIVSHTNTYHRPRVRGNGGQHTHQNLLHGIVFFHTRFHLNVAHLHFCGSCCCCWFVFFSSLSIRNHSASEMWVVWSNVFGWGKNIDDWRL